MARTFLFYLASSLVSSLGVFIYGPGRASITLLAMDLRGMFASVWSGLQVCSGAVFEFCGSVILAVGLSFGPVFGLIFNTVDWLVYVLDLARFVDFGSAVLPLVWTIVLFVMILVPVLVLIAYSTLLERKLMGSIQRRKGPNVVGVFGLLQPLADGLKLLLKEFFWPKKSYLGIYIFASSLGLFISLFLWIFLPLNELPFLSIPLLLLCIIAIQIIEAYSLILAGWASNSKYALLGSLRTTAQMISYELSVSFILLIIVLLSGSVDLLDIVLLQRASGWFVFPLLPLIGIFIAASLAETNRTPFDLPEAEAELVAGYNVEYSGMLFALFFLAEYSNMALLSTLIAIFFFGGWDLPGVPLVSTFLQSSVLGLKTGLFLVVFIWVRATLPRYRYDQLMDLGWKVFLPLTFSFFLFFCGLLYGTGLLPIAELIILYEVL